MGMSNFREERLSERNSSPELRLHFAYQQSIAPLIDYRQLCRAHCMFRHTGQDYPMANPGIRMKT